MSNENKIFLLLLWRHFCFITSHQRISWDFLDQSQARILWAEKFKSFKNLKSNCLVPYLNIKKSNTFAYFHHSYTSRNNIYDSQNNLRYVGGIYFRYQKQQKIFHHVVIYRVCINSASRFHFSSSTADPWIMPTQTVEFGFTIAWLFIQSQNT